MKLQKIGFIGLGLIGGSIAKRLRILHKDLVIIATAGHAATIEAAYKEGLTDNASPCELSDFYDCDYIFLCTPVQKNMEYLRLLKGHVCDRCIITDVGSVKTDIHREVTALGMEAQFIGGHPMAGSERIGFANSKAGLLENALLAHAVSAYPDRRREGTVQMAAAVTAAKWCLTGLWVAGLFGGLVLRAARL